MSYKSIDIRCEACLYRWNDLVEREHEDDTFVCPWCGELAGKRTISAPMVLEKTYHMGRDNADAKDYKESLKLEQQAYSTPPAKRKELLKEVKKLRSIKK